MAKAIDLDLMDGEILEELIVSAPYNPLNNTQDFKRLLISGIGAVHSVATKLHSAQYRDELVVYFGRAGASTIHLNNRWKARGHRYGMVLASVPTKEIRDAEGDTIRLFKTLEQSEHGLCIKRLDNIKKGGDGPLPNTPRSVIYITWHFERAGEIGKIPQSEIPELAHEVYNELVWDLSTQSIKTILQKTREYSHMVPLRWYAGHPE